MGEIRTERLRLRAFTPDDVDAYLLLFEQLRTEGVPRLYTSCSEGVGTPQPFYQRLGFAPTGDIIDDEIELVLEL